MSHRMEIGFAAVRRGAVLAEHLHSGHRQRVKKRYVEHGIEPFAPHELVEMLLFFGIPQRDTNPLAHRLLAEFGSVRGILQAERSLLLQVEGMTDHAATLLTFVGDLRRYCDQEEMPVGSLLLNTDLRVKYLRPRFDGLSAETVWMVSLDQTDRVIASHRLNTGTRTASEIGVRDVLRFALADNAEKVILAHNHPSGLALPSQADIDTTVAMANLLKGAGMALVDHLIFAKDNDCISFRETAVLRPTLEGQPV